MSLVFITLINQRPDVNHVNYINSSSGLCRTADHGLKTSFVTYGRIAQCRSKQQISYLVVPYNKTEPKDHFCGRSRHKIFDGFTLLFYRMTVNTSPLPGPSLSKMMIMMMVVVVVITCTTHDRCTPC